MKNKASQIRSYYNERLNTFQDTYKIYDWESKEAQLKRFEALVNTVDLDNLSFLDVGCGCGDLYDYFLEKDIKAHYHGVDIVEGMIRRARESFPGIPFYHADLFKDSEFAVSGFDVVFVSGVFNLNLGNNDEFFINSIPVLKSITKKILVMNLLDDSSPNKDDERYFYFDPQKAATDLTREDWSVEIFKGYLDNDFTLICSRSM